MLLMNTMFHSRINSKFGLHHLFVCPVEEDMGHCVGWMELQRLCTLVFISILYLTNDNYYRYNEQYMLLMYQFIIMLCPIYNNFTCSPIEDMGWSNRGNHGHDWTVL